ncbi:hypothetical protein EXIGLDRAFT_834494 [Exidia glandulosa HHB12029]|uniref:Uncharacterized protein n=1 Tax=Exidia glandulosa HHB12029 TaxID=1314781 RepID=A0A165JNN0_EXIGL|nr:hypothetical protein EXIGLDRAFT_834494 [Exidia glandulosa HHB12029]
MSEKTATFAHQHAHVLRQIAEVDYAPAALEQAIERTRKIVLDVQATGKRLKELRDKTQEERAEHLDLQDSVGRKWMHKLTGRGDEFDEKAAKEEREYLDALEQEKRTQTVYEKLEADWAVARNEESDLRRVCKERDDLLEQLDDLYKAVFDGPTPSFPQEDNLEGMLRKAQEENDRARAQFIYYQHLATLLSDALGKVQQMGNTMTFALDNSINDIFGVGEYYLNMHGERVERAVGLHDRAKAEKLRTVSRLAGEVVALLAQAQQYDPIIPQLGLMNTPLPSGWDMYGDNVISDVMMHERIKDAQPVIASYYADLEPYVSPAVQRAAVEEQHAAAAAEALNKARRDLYDFRAGAFAIAVGNRT